MHRRISTAHLAGVLALSLTGSLAACSAEQGAIASAQHAVKQSLKDPPSARFGEAFVVVKPPTKDGVVMQSTCGIVDGKNGFGGYTGGTRYVAMQSAGPNGVMTFSVTIEDGNRQATLDNKTTTFEKVYWNANCVDAAHPATHSGEEAPY